MAKEQNFLNYLSDLGSIDEVLQRAGQLTKAHAIFLYDSEGKVLYPASGLAAKPVEDYQSALRYEARGQSFEAAEEYEYLLSRFVNTSSAAFLLQKAVEQYRLAGESDKALSLIQKYYHLPSIFDSVDQRGQLIRANLLLLFTELSPNKKLSDEFLNELVSYLPKVRKVNTAQMLFIQRRLKVLQPSLNLNLYDLESHSLDLSNSYNSLADNYIKVSLLKGRV